jgi:hypothetical protein
MREELYIQTIGTVHPDCTLNSTAGAQMLVEWSEKIAYVFLRKSHYMPCRHQGVQKV